MKRIIFILSLIFMIGIQAKSNYYEGTCIDIVHQDPSKDFYYNCSYCDIIPVNIPFILYTVANGYVQTMTIEQTDLEMHCYDFGKNDYFDIPVQVKNNGGGVVNCYIRIQFIKK